MKKWIAILAAGIMAAAIPAVYYADDTGVMAAVVREEQEEPKTEGTAPAIKAAGSQNGTPDAGGAAGQDRADTAEDQSGDSDKESEKQDDKDGGKENENDPEAGQGTDPIPGQDPDDPEDDPENSKDPDDPANSKDPEDDPGDPKEPENDPGNPEEPAGTSDAALTVEKSVTSNPPLGDGYIPGETITYGITVTNSGNVELSNVTVSDPLTELTYVIPVLGAGGSAAVETSYVVAATDAPVIGEPYRMLVNTASAQADPVEDPETHEALVPFDEDSAEAKIYAGDLPGEEAVLTIHYFLDTAGGSQAAPDYVRTLKEGDTFNVVSPKITGWTPGLVRVKGTLEEDTAVDVVYTRNSHTVTVYYVDENGRRIASPSTDTLYYGDAYRIAPPDISGYTALSAQVSGTMPDRDVQISFIYRVRTAEGGEPEEKKDSRESEGTSKAQTTEDKGEAEETPAIDPNIVINNYDTPLGLGSTSLNAGECLE